MNRLPDINEEERHYLHNNSDLDGVINWVRGYAQRAVDAAAPDPVLLKEYAVVLRNPLGVAVLLEASEPTEERAKYLRHLGRSYLKADPAVAWPKWLHDTFKEPPHA